MPFETFTTHARTCASGLTSARKKSLARPSPSTTPHAPGNTCNHRKIRTFVPPLSPVPISCLNLPLPRLLHLRGLSLCFLGSPLSHSLASWVANRSCVSSVSHVMLSVRDVMVTDSCTESLGFVTLRPRPTAHGPAPPHRPRSIPERKPTLRTFAVLAGQQKSEASPHSRRLNGTTELAIDRGHGYVRRRGPPGCPPPKACPPPLVQLQPTRCLAKVRFVRPRDDKTFIVNDDRGPRLPWFRRNLETRLHHATRGYRINYLPAAAKCGGARRGGPLGLWGGQMRSRCAAARGNSVRKPPSQISLKASQMPLGTCRLDMGIV